MTITGNRLQRGDTKEFLNEEPIKKVYGIKQAPFEGAYLITKDV
ncbi:hypothetical protein [Paenibacillus sp.]|jgi:ABC-type cobalamin/Fe3+-siderophores transport system ATPase subunit|nr:hypothetical protein [Paenibacillus sp.]